ncbi:hypothetical protein K438DRAFT_511794 [Mycena galopus ATCC 62051]|nr:hypothetical protein K438DRAFT_511794 [Mycena galopus ATCC 62051]
MHMWRSHAAYRFSRAAVHCWSSILCGCVRNARWRCGIRSCGDMKRVYYRTWLILSENPTSPPPVAHPYKGSRQCSPTLRWTLGIRPLLETKALIGNVHLIYILSNRNKYIQVNYITSIVARPWWLNVQLDG